MFAFNAASDISTNNCQKHLGCMCISPVCHTLLLLILELTSRRVIFHSSVILLIHVISIGGPQGIHSG